MGAYSAHGRISMAENGGGHALQCHLALSRNRPDGHLYPGRPGLSADPGRGRRDGAQRHPSACVRGRDGRPDARAGDPASWIPEKLRDARNLMADRTRSIPETADPRLARCAALRSHHGRRNHPAQPAPAEARRLSAPARSCPGAARDRADRKDGLHHRLAARRRSAAPGPDSGSTRAPRTARSRARMVRLERSRIRAVPMDAAGRWQ